MDEVEAMIEGVGINIGDLNDAADRHLVDQQFENSLVLVVFALSSCGLNIFGERLTAEIAAPTWIPNCGFAKRGIGTGGRRGHFIYMVCADIVGAAHCTKRHQIGRHALDLFGDAEITLERKFFAAGRADARGGTFV